MTTVTYNRRVGRTGRPLGMVDVLSKLVETAGQALQQWFAARRVQRAERDAAEVRRMADSYRKIAPGFAADLYAAADQHELHR